MGIAVRMSRRSRAVTSACGRPSLPNDVSVTGAPAAASANQASSWRSASRLEDALGARLRPEELRLELLRWELLRAAPPRLPPGDEWLDGREEDVRGRRGLDGIKERGSYRLRAAHRVRRAARGRGLGVRETHVNDLAGNSPAGAVTTATG
jgi:hypothetical protein